MSKVRITKQFTFETGHALYGHDGKCKNIHGHSYKLSVTIFGKPLGDPKSSKFRSNIYQKSYQHPHQFVDRFLIDC